MATVKEQVMGCNGSMGFYHYVNQDCIRYSICKNGEGLFEPYSVSSDSGEVHSFPEFASETKDAAADKIIQWAGLGTRASKFQYA